MILCDRSLRALEHLEFHMEAGSLDTEIPHFQHAEISLGCHLRLRGLLIKERFGARAKEVCSLTALQTTDI